MRLGERLGMRLCIHSLLCPLGGICTLERGMQSPNLFLHTFLKRKAVYVPSQIFRQNSRTSIKQGKAWVASSDDDIGERFWTRYHHRHNCFPNTWCHLMKHPSLVPRLPPAFRRFTQSKKVGKPGNEARSLGTRLEAWERG